VVEEAWMSRRSNGRMRVVLKSKLKVLKLETKDLSKRGYGTMKVKIKK